MKRVFLYAYDKQNLGDDLFVYIITKRYPDSRFYIWSNKENQVTYRSLSNLKVIDKNNAIVQLLNRLRASCVSWYRVYLEKRCQAVVYIGGSIFMEYKNWKQILTWWDYETQHRPFYIIGANFGPYHSEAFREKLAEIFGNAKDVCFRDRYSYKKFQEVLTVRYAPDILFSYPIPKVSVVPKQIFISPINCSERGEGEQSLSVYSDGYFSVLSEILKGYLRDGYHLILASFCRAEGDEQAVKKIMSSLSVKEGDPRIRCLLYDGINVNEMLSGIASSEYVIATRFHATILSLAARRPVFPIVYSDKTINVLNDIEFRGKYADLRNMGKISYAYSRVNLEHPQNIDIENLAKKAEEHFGVLDCCLNKME